MSEQYSDTVRTAFLLCLWQDIVAPGTFYCASQALSHSLRNIRRCKSWNPTLDSRHPPSRWTSISLGDTFHNYTLACRQQIIPELFPVAASRSHSHPRDHRGPLISQTRMWDYLQSLEHPLLVFNDMPIEQVHPSHPRRRLHDMPDKADLPPYCIEADDNELLQAMVLTILSLHV